MSANNPPPPTSSPIKSNWRPSPQQIIGGLAVILLLIFIFENTNRVKIRFIVPQVEAPLYVALLLAAVFGALAMWLIQWRMKARKK